MISHACSKIGIALGDYCDNPKGVGVKRENTVPFAGAQGGNVEKHALYAEIEDLLGHHKKGNKRSNGYIYEGMVKLLKHLKDNVDSINQARLKKLKKRIAMTFENINLCGPRVFVSPADKSTKVCELFYAYGHMMSSYHNELESLFEDYDLKALTELRTTRRRLLGDANKRMEERALAAGPIAGSNLKVVLKMKKTYFDKTKKLEETYHAVNENVAGLKMQVAPLTENHIKLGDKMERIQKKVDELVKNKAKKNKEEKKQNARLCQTNTDWVRMDDAKLPGLQEHFCQEYSFDLSDSDVQNYAFAFLEEQDFGRGKSFTKFITALTQYARFSVVDGCPAPVFRPSDISIQEIDMNVWNVTNVKREKEWAMVIQLDKTDPNTYLRSELPNCGNKMYLPLTAVRVQVYVDKSNCCRDTKDYVACQSNQACGSSLEPLDHHLTKRPLAYKMTIRGSRFQWEIDEFVLEGTQFTSLTKDNFVRIGEHVNEGREPIRNETMATASLHSEAEFVSVLVYNVTHTDKVFGVKPTPSVNVRESLGCSTFSKFLGLLFMLVLGAGSASAAPRPPIDRETVVARHSLRFESSGVDPTAHAAWQSERLLLGGGGHGGGGTFPLYTLSNWGWHTPDPTLRGAGVANPFFRADGSLNYTNMEVHIASADRRPGKGNRTVPYQFNCGDYNDKDTCAFLLEFPARVNLGQLAFVLAEDDDDQPRLFRHLNPRQIVRSVQTLDPWRGEIASNWSYDQGNGGGASMVSVLTVVDATTDTHSTQWRAPRALGLAAQLAFCTISKAGGACEWDPKQIFEPHITRVLANRSAADGRSGRLDLHRSLPAGRTAHVDAYAVSCVWTLTGGMPGDRLRLDHTAEHAFALHTILATNAADETDINVVVELSCRYESLCCVGTTKPRSPTSLSHSKVPAFGTARTRTNKMWRGFWTGGAFVDIAGRTDDPRAKELERRTVLSAYLLRAQESGAAPPQESGLLYNSWNGKHHSEMRFWHQTWLPLWGHPELLARSDEWFIHRLPQARAHAASQGYAGARWGKMLGESNPHGLGAPASGGGGLMYWESPNNINPGLVWHQPHVVYMAELEYQACARAGASCSAADVLRRMRDVVLNTTAFIADFPERRMGTGTKGKYYDLGPPLVSAAEGEGPFDVWNPTYELTQFRFAIEIGQLWRVRFGLKRRADWDDVLRHLAPPPIVTTADGTQVYNRHQNCLPSVFDPDARHCQGTLSHPALTGALGCLPLAAGNGTIDRTIMNATLHETLRTWSWNGAWGWDQPMVALTATRLEQPEVALATLLMNATTNAYLPTGYNHPSVTGDIRAYLPGNGGTLMAVALMAGGWAGAPAREAPGFPPEWDVSAEGFTPYF
eukprot:g4165.t1